MQSPTFYVDVDKSPIFRGAMKFEYQHSVVTRRGTRSIEKRYYACPVCLSAFKARVRRMGAAGINKRLEPLLVPADQIDRHLVQHDTREEHARLKRLKAEMGMSDPIPGQLGFAALGLPDIPRADPPKRRVGRSR